MARDACREFDSAAKGKSSIRMTFSRVPECVASPFPILSSGSECGVRRAMTVLFSERRIKGGEASPPFERLGLQMSNKN